jgi:hypothetical protein
MPSKSKNKYNAYMKQYMRAKREVEINRRYYGLLIQEFKDRTALPRHVYELRQVLNEMLEDREIGGRTDLIAESYLRLTDDNIVR